MLLGVDSCRSMLVFVDIDIGLCVDVECAAIALSWAEGTPFSNQFSHTGVMDGSGFAVYTEFTFLSRLVVREVVLSRGAETLAWVA